MSLDVATTLGRPISFPRVSGDEPVMLAGRGDGRRFSPRERG